MAAANRDLLEGEFSDGCGKLDRDGAEADADGSVGLLDVVDGEPGDRGGPLRIEEQQQAGEAVGRSWWATAWGRCRMELSREELFLRIRRDSWQEGLSMRALYQRFPTDLACGGRPCVLVLRVRRLRA
ncbi:hypothetical protein SXANM310S_02564 [Streptomyces xanthochromogenes]